MIDLITEPPKVFVVGHTVPNWGGLLAYMQHTGFEYKGQTAKIVNTSSGDFGVTIGDPSVLAEIGGRLSYESWNRSDTPIETYLQNSIISHGHTSVLEHAVFNLLIVDTCRSVQTELNRHRVGISPSWNSQRYTDKRLRFVVPPRMRGNDEWLMTFNDWMEDTVAMYKELKEVASSGADEGTLKKKRATEAARAVLPNMAACDGLLTINARALRHLIGLRTDAHADLSIRELTYIMYVAVKDIAPALFADAVETPAELVPEVRFTHG